MASGETARRKLKFPKTSDPDKMSKDWEEFANQLDNDAKTSQGTEAERPAFGTRGYQHMVQGDGTAEKNNILWWDTGTGWVALQNRVGDGQVYTTPTVRAQDVSFEPSAIRATLVILTVVTAATEYTQVAIKVGEAEPATVAIPAGDVGASPQAPVTIIVPKGVTWKWHLNSGQAEVKSTYLPL